LGVKKSSRLSALCRPGLLALGNPPLRPAPSRPRWHLCLRLCLTLIPHQALCRVYHTPLSAKCVASLPRLFPQRQTALWARARPNHLLPSPFTLFRCASGLCHKPLPAFVRSPPILPLHSLAHIFHVPFPQIPLNRSLGGCYNCGCPFVAFRRDVGGGFQQLWISLCIIYRYCSITALPAY